MLLPHKQMLDILILAAIEKKKQQHFNAPRNSGRMKSVIALLQMAVLYTALPSVVGVVWTPAINPCFKSSRKVFTPLGP
jgi:hypothetical protein